MIEDVLSALVVMSIASIVGLPFLVGWRSPKAYDRVYSFYNLALGAVLIGFLGLIVGSAMTDAHIRSLRPDDEALAAILDQHVIGQPYLIWMPWVVVGYMAAMLGFDILVVRPSLEEKAAQQERDRRRDRDDR